MFALGSSPLARGLRDDFSLAHFRGRIIPARAGFTPCGSNTCANCRDHPRSRGVYSTPGRKRRRRPGSSPLARGLRRQSAGDHRRRGIIPARAGFTFTFGVANRVVSDHPRSRGVYEPVTAYKGGTVGSSPLARGLRTVLPCRSANAGIIPARAGFTSRFWVGCERPPDHPRSRGVYSWCSPTNLLACGSSPLARGLRALGQRAAAVAGIIPARAGFTASAPGSGRSWGDHPHSRGVYA